MFSFRNYFFEFDAPFFASEDLELLFEAVVLESAFLSDDLALDVLLSFWFEVFIVCKI